MHINLKSPPIPVMKGILYASNSSDKGIRQHIATDATVILYNCITITLSYASRNVGTDVNRKK